MFSPSSSAKLQGQGQAASKSAIRTSVGGRVVAVLPNGNLVIEAQRESNVNNERQTVVLRGIVRPGDVAPDNSVLSTQLSDLEMELKGHGIVSDATRPPNWVVRTILKVLGF
jgi:flagellar L-ring protein precursor FlgH